MKRLSRLSRLSRPSMTDHDSEHWLYSNEVLQLDEVLQLWRFASLKQPLQLVLKAEFSHPDCGI